MDLNGKQTKQPEILNPLTQVIKVVYWIVSFILISIFVGYLLGFVFDFQKVDKDCIDSCIVDNSLCLSGIEVIYDKNYFSYVDETEVYDCSSELEYCVNNC